jgi:DNA end-binding protein Ku
MDEAASGYRHGMARPIWSGTISFGLVNVPVKAHSAVHDHTVHFHQLEKDTGARIRYEKVSAKSGRSVPKEDIEKGFEVSKGHYVVVDDEEIADLRPRSTKAIEITDFVALDEVDPIYYEHTYWLVPDRSEAAARAYQLLLAAMDQARRVAIGTVVMRNKQYLAAVRPLDGALAMSTMRFADEVVPRKDIDGLPSRRSKPPDKELRLASQIVESLSSDWDPARYHDTYSEEMRDLIAAKAEGKDITVEAEEEEPTAEVIDLMAALQASVDAQRSGGRRTTRRRTGSSTAKKATKKATKQSARSTASRRRSSA